MRKLRIGQALQAMASTPGVIACALVDIETGMVFASAGDHPNIDSLAEAASDYWRLYQRIRANFDEIGPLDAVSAQHRYGVVSLIPCGEGMVVATISKRKMLDWLDWIAKVSQLSKMLD